MTSKAGVVANICRHILWLMTLYRESTLELGNLGFLNCDLSTSQEVCRDARLV